MTKSVHVMVRFTPEEAGHIRAIVKANTGTISEFVRACVLGALAREGDPESTRMLSILLEKGLHKAIERRVKNAIKVERAKLGK